MKVFKVASIEPFIMSVQEPWIFLARCSFPLPLHVSSLQSLNRTEEKRQNIDLLYLHIKTQKVYTVNQSEVFTSLRFSARSSKRNENPEALLLLVPRGVRILIVVQKT